MAYEWITEENLRAIDAAISMLGSDPSMIGVIKRIRNGEATQEEVLKLASRSGRAAGNIISGSLADHAVDGRVTEDIARAAIMKPLERNYEYVADLAGQVQESLNRKAGLGLKAVKPEFNRSRAEGLVTEVCGKEEVTAFTNTLTQQIENVSMSTVDDSVRANAEAHYHAGLSPKIERIADPKCCEWCSALAGTYDYSKVNGTGNDVFRRHNNCRCQVLYNPGDGKKWQDVHSKRLLSAGERDKIKARIKVGLDQEQKTPEQRNLEAFFLRQAQNNNKDSSELTKAVNDNHEALGKYTPSEMKSFLEKLGFTVLPLGSNSKHFKNVPFEEGGGFRILYGDDGVFLYHPPDGYHGDGYWKVTNGKEGTHRYDRSGKPYIPKR